MDTPTPERHAGAWTRRLAVAGPVLLMLALACTPGISFTEDLGRHLLLGRLILEQRVVPHTNYLTYTHPDFPFVNHHWLSEVVFYGLHRLVGFNGLIVLKMGAMAAALWLALRTVVPRGGLGGYWLAGLLVAVMLGFRAHVRPELFTFLGVAFYGWCFERIRRGARWPRWVLIPAAWFWANAHIYFIFGLGMAVAFALERGIERRSWSAFAREAAWVAALAAASSLNPHGVRGLLYPLRIFSNYELAVTENASPLEYWRTVVNPLLLALPPFTLLLLAAAARHIPRPAAGNAGASLRLANLLIAAAALVATWRMARSAPLLALAGLPVIAAGMGRRGLRQTRPRFWPAVVGERGRRPNRPAPEAAPLREDAVATAAPAGSRPPPAGGWRAHGARLAPAAPLLLNLALFAGVVTGGYSRRFPSPIAPTPFGFDDERRYGALRELRAQGLHGPVFSDYNIGSLVEYNLWPERGYVDNRPEAFPTTFWRDEYLPALELGAAWERMCAERGINAVIVSLTGVKEFFTQALMRRPEWALVHLDSLCAVWVRRTPENAGLIRARGLTAERLQACERALSERLLRLPDTPFWRRPAEVERALFECYGLVCVGAADRAWPHVRQLYLMYPDHQMVHELMRVTVPPDQAEPVKAVLAARARWPVAAKQVLDWGRVLETEGRRDAAREVYRRGRWFFPLSSDLRAALQRVARD